MKKLYILIITILFFTLTACAYPLEKETAFPDNNITNEPIDDIIPNDNIEHGKDISTDDDINSNSVIKDNVTEIYRQYKFVTIEYNSITYSKYLNDKLFDAASVYCDIDYSSLKPTKETVTATYYYRNETDGLSEGKTENVTLYQLPDNMQNDSGIHFIAAKLSDRDCEIFYKLKDTAEQSTIYDWLDTNQRLWGKNYTAVDEIKNITIIEQKANGRQCIIDDTIDISGFFERICNFKYKADTEYRTVGRENEKPGLYGITINYKDGYQMTFTFERIRQVLQGNYLTDDEFEDYLLSFLE